MMSGIAVGGTERPGWFRWTHLAPSGASTSGTQRVTTPEWQRRLERKIAHADAIDSRWLPAAKAAVESAVRDWKLKTPEAVVQVLAREHPDVLAVMPEHGEGEVVKVIEGLMGRSE